MLKRIGVAVAAIALLLPLQVIAQKGGRSSFDAPDKAAIEQLFERYSAAFSSKDYVKLREYLQVPFVRFGPSNTRVETAPADWAILPTMDEAINFYRAAQDALATQGVERFEWGQTRITALSVDRALVNKTYRRYRKDGTLLQEAASFYLVSKSSGSWKICGILKLLIAGGIDVNRKTHMQIRK
jgi:NTF2-like protein (DUF6841)